jgi:hypothetical protein
MKVLLDECMPRKLCKLLGGHFVKTVPQMGWASLKNGKLLALAEKEFEIFLTVDSNLSSQQHLSKFNIAVIVLKTRSNRLKDLREFVPEIFKSLPLAKKGEAVFISSSQ